MTNSYKVINVRMKINDTQHILYYYIYERDIYLYIEYYIRFFYDYEYFLIWYIYIYKQDGTLHHIYIY